MTEIAFIKGGDIAISTFVEKLGFQIAYSVDYKYDITETLVAVSESLEYESHSTKLPSSNKPVLFESLKLARGYVHSDNIKKTNRLKDEIAQRKSSISYKISCFWHSLFPSETGVKPTVDEFASYVSEECKRLKTNSNSDITYTPLPKTFKCGAILPIGCITYNLRADNILFDGKFTLSENVVTGAEPMNISLENNEIRIRYCLNDSKDYMLEKDDTCEYGVLKKGFANSRYFADKEAATKTFNELKNIISLDMQHVSKQLNRQ